MSKSLSSDSPQRSLTSEAPKNAVVERLVLCSEYLENYHKRKFGTVASHEQETLGPTHTRRFTLAWRSKGRRSARPNGNFVFVSNVSDGNGKVNNLSIPGNPALSSAFKILELGHLLTFHNGFRSPDTESQT